MNSISNLLYQELSFLKNTLLMTFEQILVINNLNELMGCHSNSS